MTQHVLTRVQMFTNPVICSHQFLYSPNTMHPYSLNNFTAETVREDTEKKVKVKCLIFGANVVTRKMIADYNKEHGNTLAFWVAEDLALKRTDLLSQYIDYHKPGWVVYVPVIQTVASVDSCTHQLARLVEIASQGKVQLAVLVRRSLVENLMAAIHLHHGHSVEIVTSVEQLVRTVGEEQGRLEY